MTTTALQDYLSVYGLDLQVTLNPTKGRAIISTDYHKRGTVLVTSQPLGTVALPSSRHEICNYCFRKPQTPTALQRCSQCKSAYFCDMACFKMLGQVIINMFVSQLLSTINTWGTTTIRMLWIWRC
ncbi:unnamed protein product [Absidia cylindrospora]